MEGVTQPPDSPAQLPLELPIEGVLDLHTFQPAQLSSLLGDYLAACQARGILELRIIHGKGIGNLKRGVEAFLGRHPEVLRYAPASALYGGAGATIVYLRPKRAFQEPPR